MAGISRAPSNIANGCLLEAALHKAHGNQSQMARLLGITPRSIYNKVHKYQLRP